VDLLPLEATPYPDQERDLNAGELWLSYDSIRESIGEEGKKISMSTVSGALKYLEENGYLALHPVKFKGIKAAVANWAGYKAAVPTAAGDSLLDTPRVAGDNLSTIPRVAGENQVKSQALDLTTGQSSHQ